MPDLWHEEIPFLQRVCEVVAELTPNQVISQGYSKVSLSWNDKALDNTDTKQVLQDQLMTVRVVIQDCRRPVTHFVYN